MITAAQLMSPVFALAESMSVRDALHALLERHLHGAPVTGPSGAIAGVISVGDLARGLLYEPALPELCVGSVMTRNALSVPGGVGVYECAQTMLARDVHRLVVVDTEGRAVGVLTPSDILRGMVNLGEAFRVRAEPVHRDRP